MTHARRSGTGFTVARAVASTEDAADARERGTPAAAASDLDASAEDASSGGSASSHGTSTATTFGRRPRGGWFASAATLQSAARAGAGAVSYTHLTLPTILLV